MDVVFTNIRPIWMVSQEARDVGSRWMSPTAWGTPQIQTICAISVNSAVTRNGPSEIAEMWM